MDRAPTLIREALRLARRGYGDTTPNPMVGALLVKGGKVIGRGWHKRAGGPHAEIEAIRDAQKRGLSPRGATLYVTLEPCSTHGRTPPCCDAIIQAGIKKLIAAATDPNPNHAGRGFDLLRRAGLKVTGGILADEAARLNEAFNHWIVTRTPFVTVKAAMSMDGKIATSTGESKWITSPESRAIAMQLRRGCDAILVGVNTVLADNPALSVRLPEAKAVAKRFQPVRQPWRIVLDSEARTPISARLVSDEHADRTIVVVTRRAIAKRVKALEQRVSVWQAPERRGSIDLRWLINKLGKAEITSLLVEGGGEVNASFLFGGHAQRVAFFYAPKVIGGHDSRKGVAGPGVAGLAEAVKLVDVEWNASGPDLVLTARVGYL